MNWTYKGWQRLFLWSLGLFLGTAFCMKWMEGDFAGPGGLFTIIGLEIGYPADRIREILGGLDARVSTILRYHLVFDFAFMAGVYPGIASLCMMARDKIQGSRAASLLLVMALAQLLAWACDIYENYCLLTWLRDPSGVRDIGLYHGVVMLKWALALAGLALALAFVFRKRRLAP